MAGPGTAEERAQRRAAGEVWIDHAELVERDIEWLRDVRHLTLWNVTTPPGLLAQLPRLLLLDVRGGSRPDLGQIEGCAALRGLSVNQVRGLNDLSPVTSLATLEYLSLYGLAKVTTTPSLGTLANLTRIDVGRMTGLANLGGLLDAAALKEILVIGKVSVTDADVALIRSLKALRAFDWVADGQVPNKQWQPVVESVGLPKAKPCFMRDWLRLGST